MVRRRSTVRFRNVAPAQRNNSNSPNRLWGRKRRHGVPDPKVAIMADSMRVAGGPVMDPQSADWMGWRWSSWTPARDACRSAAGIGLYRLRRSGIPGLVYVGQGIIATRFSAHLSKATKPDHLQAQYFSGDLAASWVALPNTAIVNLREHENDLIAAHVLTMGCAPPAQFLGNRSTPA